MSSGLGGSHDYDDDDKELGQSGKNSRFKDFDCPDCNANNPVDPPFGDGDEIRCNYCGMEYKTLVNDEGRVKFREA
jgi:ribosomal protein S27E